MSIDSILVSDVTFGCWGNTSVNRGRYIGAFYVSQMSFSLINLSSRSLVRHVGWTEKQSSVSGIHRPYSTLSGSGKIYY